MIRLRLVPLLFLLFSCKAVPRAENAVVGDAVTVPLSTGTIYKADIENSFIEWIGTKPTGHHHGRIKLKTGELVLGNDEVIGGRFIMDINSLQPDDQKKKKNEMLRNHLLSDDFFDVERFAVASFEIVRINATSNKAAPYTVTGNLKLKDVERSIIFPASIIMKDGKVVAEANFNFDRTLWNMNYGNDKSLGNWFIRPDVNIKIHLTADRG